MQETASSEEEEEVLRHSDVQDELLPIHLLPAKELTLPPDDVVKLSRANYSANGVCSVLPQLQNCA